MSSQCPQTPFCFLLIVCLTIGLFGKTSACTYPPDCTAPGNDALVLLAEYERKADIDVDEITGLIHTAVVQGTERVEQLYAEIGRQLQNTIGRAIANGCSEDADARQLQSSEIPFYLGHVNRAIQEATDNINRIADTFNAEVRRLFEQGKNGVDHTTSPAVIGQQVARLTERVEAGVNDAIQLAQSDVQRVFTKATRIVQAYISLILSRVRTVMAAPVAQRVNADIENTNKRIVGVLDRVLVLVKDALQQFHSIFLRLGPFLDELNQLE